MAEAEKTGFLGSIIKIVGLIASTVAITLGLTSLWNLYRAENPKSKLELTVDCQKFELPPSAVKQLDILRVSIRSDEVEKLVEAESNKFKFIDLARAAERAKYLEDRAKMFPPGQDTELAIAKEKLEGIDASNDYAKGTFIREITSSIKDYNEKLWDHDYRFITSRTGTIIICTLHNGGSLAADDVTIDLPFHGEVRTLDADQVSKEFKTNGGIHAGSLRPSKDFVVTIWTDSSFLAYHEGSIVVSSKSGTGSIQLSPEFKAVAGVYETPKFSDFLFWIWNLFTGLVAFIGSLYFLGRLISTVSSRPSLKVVSQPQIAEGSSGKDTPSQRTSDSEVSI